MAFEFFIALRQLMSRERRALISIITGISILGVVIGVTALIAVISVIEGAQADYFQNLVDQFAHIEVHDPLGRELYEYGPALEILRADPEVEAATPFLRRYAMLKREAGFNAASGFRPLRLFGMDVKQENRVTRLNRSPEKSLGKLVPGDNEIVIGAILARQMGLRPGDDVYALTGKVARTATGIVPKQSRLRVVGIFQADLFEIDQGVGYVSLETCQRMNLLEDEVDLLHARIRDPYRAEEVKERLAQAYLAAARDPDSPLYARLFKVRSWADLNPDFFRALRMEKAVMFIITLLVVMVAALNIIATLILVTMEKTRQIGILRAMGCSRAAISRIFLLQGALIGFVGAALGVCCGLALCWVLKHHPPVEIPAAVYGLDGIPVLVQWHTVGLICACSLAICVGAAALPAYTASRLDITEALRHE